MIGRQKQHLQEHLATGSPVRLLTRLCAAVFVSLALAGDSFAVESDPDLPVLVEAEGFADTGGWVIDPQFMDLMGSPYLLAHGLGVPVEDATTEVVASATGTPRPCARRYGEPI